MYKNDIMFDEDYCLYDIFIDEEINPITLVISDGLYAADEILQDNYKGRIANFINSSKKWFPIAYEKIVSEIGNVDGLRLTKIYILFEQDQNNGLYGLSFNLDFDREHGRGMMLDGESFAILKYGDASVAFEGM